VTSHFLNRRREFIKLLGGAAAWPLGARAQQQAVPVIGLLGSESLDWYTDRLRAFREGLGETGYVDSEALFQALHSSSRPCLRQSQLRAHVIARADVLRAGRQFGERRRTSAGIAPTPPGKRRDRG